MINQPPATERPTPGEVSPRVSAATSFGLRRSDRWTGAVVDRYGPYVHATCARYRSDA